MAHMKRYSVPGFWSVPKKGKIFVVRPSAGPHRKRESIPLQVLLREVLGYAQDAREAREILNSGGVLVDKRVRKEPKHPVGLMDVVEIPEINAHFRMVAGRKGLSAEKIGKEESHVKLCRITGKRNIRGGGFQLSLHDGRNLTIKKNAYKVGDSLLISLPGQDVLKHYGFDRGAKGTIIAGKNIGISGKVKDFIVKKNMLEKSTVTVESGNREIKTLTDYILIGEITKHAADRKPDRKEAKAKKREAVKKKRKERIAKQKKKRGRKKAEKMPSSKKKEAAEA
jgi:small subunit ribosomal protein S4e